MRVRKRNKSARGNHVSVFVNVMEGEYDQQLQWPFRGKLEIQLLNQDQDEEHHTDIIDFGGTYRGEAGNRVTKEEEIPKFERGFSDFISHGALRPKYLNFNNYLTFRVISK